MRGIDWLIAGGETGAGSGVMSKAEARRVRDACQRWEVKFWLKQWGGTAGPPKDAAILDGRRWTERPATSADVA
jgi:protein gp37